VGNLRDMVGASLRRRAGLPSPIDLDPDRIVVGNGVGSPAIVARFDERTVYVYADASGLVPSISMEGGELRVDGVTIETAR
jgi:hypothetical protein